MISRLRPAGAALAALFLMLFGLTLSTAASAHDQLVSSSPADGDELASQPEWLELEFSGNVQEIGSEIRVIGPDDADVSAGEITIEGRTLSSALPDNLGPGEYTVQWRVVSEDSHPIDGSFSFTIGDDGAAGQDGAAAEGDGDGAQLGGAAVDQPEDGAQDQGTLSEDASGSGMSTPMIILLSVGGLAVVVLVVLLLMRKQKGLPGTPGNPEDGAKG
ncbi:MULTISPECIES: copper resistance CopC family protein [Brevibacterium]|uniref:Copper resistance protein CopC n=1 Tax=Brevibacterium salitolerans TaxID=1403566 RepID=A0ABN2WSU0_9MICO|nr:copper resistance CopC family protein [Brevibacterium sp.]